MTDDDTPRSIDLEIEVPGAPEEVWRAIATGPGISAWMHPCEVEEREGGAFSYDMGGGMGGSGRVTGWDPPYRFAQEEEWSPGEGAAPALLATEWLVEARSGGTCVVRMVMGGFGAGAAWDDEIDGMTEGMRAALENLRIYLTHFPGETGAWARAFGTGPADLDERWAALAGALGLVADAAEGDRIAPIGAPALSGAVEQPLALEYHRGVLLRLDAPAPGIAHALVFGHRGWMTFQACFYGADATELAAREEQAWQAWMAERFPAPASA
jgi:uncharacterized protein YndB with AHSA1/START domain